MKINLFLFILSLRPLSRNLFVAGILFLLIFFSQICAGADIYRQQINNAEENFKNGNFSGAAAIYESLINVERIKNSFVYYNLSNAYFRNGNLGNAVLNIERAYRLSPRDADIKNNRAYLRSLAGKNEDLLKDFFTGTFSLNELSVFCAVLIILILLHLSAKTFKENGIINKAAIFCAVLLIPSLFWASYKIKVEIMTYEAAALNTLTVRSGPGVNNPEIFEIKEGRIVNIISENNNWSNVSIVSEGEKFTGWVETQYIGRL